MVSRRTVVWAVSGLGIGTLGLGATAGVVLDSSNSTDDTVRMKSVSTTLERAPDFESGATIVRSSATEQQPLALDIELTWTGSDAQSVGFGNDVPFPVPTDSVADTPGLVLLSPDYEVEKRPDAWVPDRDPDDSLLGNQDATYVTFEPGETVRQRLQVWGDHRTVDAIQPGTYRFETSFGPGSVTSAEADRTPTTAPSRLELTVEIA